MSSATQSEELPECPICMEDPHNPVMLICSSSNCRPFVCDTSSRHSNCLDMYRRSSSSDNNNNNNNNNNKKLVCPLCRGTITSWVVVEEARKLMNSKTRSCSLETCDFSGNYTDLRKHARREHPSVRPSEVSPTRQSNWESLQRQIDMEDHVLAQEDGIIMDIDDDDVYVFSDPIPPSPVRRLIEEAELELDSDAEDYLDQCFASERWLRAVRAHQNWLNTLV